MRFGKLSLALGSLFALSVIVLAQSGPDTDADTAKGYVNNVFHHSNVDSINVYNGALTVPVPIGSAYPIGPKLKFQATLAYTSRVWEYGYPNDNDVIDSFLYTPIAGDPALGIGWNFNAGAIKKCGYLQNSYCYVEPNGAEHQFSQTPSPADYYKTIEGSQYYLHWRSASSDYEMWDGDGNHYVFNRIVGGTSLAYNDDRLDYVRDFGRGRDGWYLTQLEDPFHNSMTVTYWDSIGAQPCWSDPVSPGAMSCPSLAKSWIPKTITLPTGTINVTLGAGDGTTTKMIKSIDVPAVGGNVTWTLNYGTAIAYPRPGYTGSVSLQVLSSLQLPTGDQYSFGYSSTKALLTSMTLPTTGQISYIWGPYTFYKPRRSSLGGGANCTMTLPPDGSSVMISGRNPGPTGPESPEEPWEEFSPDLPQNPYIAGGDCQPGSPLTYRDQVLGVSRRTETTGGVASSTDYVQYSFPFGEQGSARASCTGGFSCAQTLTLVIPPPAVDGNSHTIATLFLGPHTLDGSSTPGDQTGAEIETRVFDSDIYGFPTQLPTVNQPPCASGNETTNLFCANHSIRDTQRTFDLDSGRHLKSETTYYQAPQANGTCTSCKYHSVVFSNATGTWDGYGRHYKTETHSGNLDSANDARTITTYWAPSNWTIAVPANQSALPNLFTQRTDTLEGSTVDRYTYFDTGNGFLKADILWDSGASRIFEHCQYADGDGNVAQEYTRTESKAPTPNPCNSSWSGVPSTPVGDAFGKQHSYFNGLLTTTTWVNGSTALSWNSVENSRDPSTGWILWSKDPAGVRTDYAYDSLGRVTSISPAGETATTITYTDSTHTSAARNGGTGLTTFEDYTYDGLGRLIKHRRQMPGTSVYSKQFMKFDKQGNEYFTSEWVDDGATETITPNQPTNCAFNAGAFATNRPSTASGTYRMCYDPFNRPQQIAGSNMSSLITVVRDDGASSHYSDTVEAAKTYCVNGTLNADATCGTGGANQVTTSTRDAFGRTVQVKEPTNDITTYNYDANSKLTKVTQSSQIRQFTYDPLGLLRSESTPEVTGSVTYDSIGSLGNVLQKTEGGVVHTYTYDAAGRLLTETAGGVRYVMNCYDGSGVNANCPDATTANFPGGASPKGKLTRRVGRNSSYKPLYPTTPVTLDVTEDYTYSGVGGRLSARATSTQGGANVNTTESWTYNSLGLVSAHGHPRFLDPGTQDNSANFTETVTYGYGLPTSIALSGRAADNSSITGATITATYSRAGTVATYAAAQTAGSTFTTTITQDSTLLPRPSRIASSAGGFDTGTYSYDGAGNILKMNKDTSNVDTFTYDSLSRLTGATLKVAGVSHTQAFEYIDRYGNLTKITTDGVARSLSASTTTNRLTSGTYDSRGNLTGYGTEALTYDSLNRQIEDANTSGSTDWQYLFNGGDERLVRVTAGSSVLNVTRREMARFIDQAKGWSQATACNESSRTFTDVHCADQDWGLIQTFYTQGITAGCGGGAYCPDAAITRAQMAVFLLKGEHGGAYTPPACTSTIFADVPCPGGTNVDWINQLYNEGVTAGCGGGNYCPLSNVTEQQMATFMSKPNMWPSYHAIPGGSFYTLRDSGNKVTTEFADSYAGRDNVFLGNLLVASYVSNANSGVTGWNFHSSDHLGSVRLSAKGSDLSSIEANKYYPFGETYSSTALTQKLAFATMERDPEASHHYDHARHQDYKLGRFEAVDKIYGNSEWPQSWNRYSYAQNNPIRYIDPTGLCADDDPEGCSANLSIGQVSAIIFNETQSLTGEAGALDVMRQDVAHAIINGDNTMGSHRPLTAPDSVTQEQELTATFKSIERSVTCACEDAKVGKDPTFGATKFNLRPTESRKPFQGAQLSTQNGPFKNSYPTQALPRGKSVYVNTYKIVPKVKPLPAPKPKKQEEIATK